MWIHFDTIELAIADLQEHSFKEIKHNHWVAGICVATIHPVPGSIQKVVVCYREI